MKRHAHFYLHRCALCGLKEVGDIRNSGFRSMSGTFFAICFSTAQCKALNNALMEAFYAQSSMPSTGGMYPRSKAITIGTMLAWEHEIDTLIQHGTLDREDT